MGNLDTTFSSGSSVERGVYNYGGQLNAQMGTLVVNQATCIQPEDQKLGPLAPEIQVQRGRDIFLLEPCC